MVSFEESMISLVGSMKEQSPLEMLFLDDALGRVLAEDIIADHNSPQFPTSAMDGYAIKCEDQQLGRIRIEGNLPAGSYDQKEVMGGFCVKTYTGSLMSLGTDTLIPIENVTREGDEIVINESVECGFSVRPIGENYQNGDILIPSGTKIDFAEIGVLASLNIPQVKVFSRPKVAILSTGSEILDVGEKQTNPSQIRSSNQFTLHSLSKKAGAYSIRFPLVKDDKKSIRVAINEALQISDIVVTTGGVSVGDYDFVKDILGDLESEYLVDGVVLKPGQHIKIVKIGKKYIFALPGFPYSSTVTFILYVIPLLRYMMGLDSTLPIKSAKLIQGYKKRSKKTEFSVGNLSYEGGAYKIDFHSKRIGTSAILTNMLGSSVLVGLSEDCGDLDIGDDIDFIDLSSL